MENLQLDNLMKEGTSPVESLGGEHWRILHGDTLKLIKAFQPGIFDALVTDPPYASGSSKPNERNRTTNQKYSSAKAENALPDFDGDNKDQRSWTHWMAEWLYDARRACKRGLPFVCLLTGDSTHPLPMPFNGQVGFGEERPYGTKGTPGHRKGASASRQSILSGEATVRCR